MFDTPLPFRELLCKACTTVVDWEDSVDGAVGADGAGGADGGGADEWTVQWEQCCVFVAVVFAVSRFPGLQFISLNKLNVVPKVDVYTKHKPSLLFDTLVRSAWMSAA